MGRNKVRAFLAVEISPDVREQLERLIGRFERAGARVKWVEPKNLHLTVKFLGDIDLTDSAQICLKLNKVLAEVPPFSVSIHGTGAFPNNGRPRTLWVGVQDGHQELVDLQQRVEDALAELHYRKEGRRFEPHLTFGRVREGRDELKTLVAEHADFHAGIFDVEELVLFSSELTPKGPIYDPLGHIELGG